jgi:hydroxymethylpyrimidine pyrophosphatase-like HAD family hydrolase
MTISNLNNQQKEVIVLGGDVDHSQRTYATDQFQSAPVGENCANIINKFLGAVYSDLSVKHESEIVYASGNTILALIDSALRSGFYPNNIICWVGARLYKARKNKEGLFVNDQNGNPVYELNQNHKNIVSNNFDAESVRRIFETYCEMNGFFYQIHEKNPNSEDKNCEGKISFYTNINDDSIAELTYCLEESGIEFRIDKSKIQSGDANYSILTASYPDSDILNFDIMHPKASKGGALTSIVYESIQKTGEYPLAVVVIGDSGNDISLAEAVRELTEKGVEAFMVIPGSANDWNYLIEPAKELLEETNFGNRLFHSSLPASAAMIEALVKLNLIDINCYDSYLNHPDMIPAIAQQLRVAAQ